MSKNKAILIGRLGSDPELKELGGTAYVGIGLATDEKFKKDGQWQKRTEWHRLAIWGQLAETVNRFAKKGDQLYVEGSIQTRTYTKDGQEKSVTEIRVTEVTFLSPKEDKPAKTITQPELQPDDLPF